MYTIYTKENCPQTAQIKKMLVMMAKKYKEVIIPRDMEYEKFKKLHPKAKGLPALVDHEPHKKHDHSSVKKAMNDLGIVTDVILAAGIFGL